jgi:ketosteroid isomerase-like protein
MGTIEHRALPRLALRGRERRPLEDRLAVRSPRLSRRLAARLTPLTLRMPRRWRLRQLLIDWLGWRANNAFHRGDVEMLRLIYHRDCSWDATRIEAFIGTRVYRGHDGLAALMTELREAWQEDSWWTDLVSVEDFDGGIFLAHQRQHGVGRASGIPVEQDLFQVSDTRDGLIWRSWFFDDRAQAVEEAKTRSRAASAP